MTSKRNFSFPVFGVLLIGLIFSSPACSQDRTNGEKIEEEQAKTENLQPEQGMVVAQKEDTPAKSTTSKPNILIIWGDDIGWFNPSAYNRGIMGYKTPNIDRLAKEGAMFTDWYGQQSCTAGRAAFITGQTAALRHSEGRKTPIGKVAIESRVSSNGRE